MKIVILGSNGQLGNELIKHFEHEKNIKSFSKDSLDITNFSAVKNMIRDEKPNVLINAAAYTAVDKAENNALKAFNINSKAVENIAENLEIIGGYLIHYSTDYVFDGLKKSPYSEIDKTCPINVYGESKLEGEKNIQAIMKNYFILRTSWVIGEHGNNFAKTILKLIKRNDSIKVVNDQYGVPTSTLLLSSITSKIISKIERSDNIESGIYNVSPKGKTTWYGIAQEILSKIIKEKKIPNNRKINMYPIMTSDYKTLAKRPKNSLLNTEKIEKILNLDLPYWEEDFNKVLNKIF